MNGFLVFLLVYADSTYVFYIEYFHFFASLLMKVVIRVFKRFKYGINNINFLFREANYVGYPGKIFLNMLKVRIFLIVQF